MHRHDRSMGPAGIFSPSGTVAGPIIPDAIWSLFPFAVL